MLLGMATAHAQVPTLYGVTTFGGANNKGTVIKVNADGSGFGVIFSFDSVGGGAPERGLCLAGTGKLYGMTNVYGAHGLGVIYSVDPNNGDAFHKVLDFDGTNGGLPWADFMRADNGMLYGPCYMGGSGGSLLRLDPSTDQVSTLYQLTQATEGGGITDHLIQGTDGKLYGVAAYGGANNHGTIFSFDLSTQVLTVLHAFTGTDGSTPYGALCEADNGLLYGITYEGGANGKGAVYSIDPVTQAYTDLVDLDGTNGQDTWCSFVQVSPNVLYGTVTNGGGGAGAVMKYDIAAQTFTTAHAFAGFDGGGLFGSVIRASDGDLYGMSLVGGDTFQGNVYRFHVANNTVTNVHSLIPAEGGSPHGALVQAGTVTGVQEYGSSADFRLYPDPTDGPVTIEVPRGAHELVITDALGHRVLVRSVADLSSTTVELGTSGVYLATITTDRGRNTQRFVVR